jgi:ATP-binding cassette subfamily B protein
MARRSANVEFTVWDGARGEGRALLSLLPHLWPKDSWELRARVAAALICLVLAKLANVYVPLVYKDAVDALAPAAATILVVPLALLFAYGLLRVLATAFGELRDAVFAKVGQRAARTMALRTFRHLHNLALSFHLDRRTGGLARAIDRGTKGIETLFSFLLFNTLPTLFEIPLVCGILWALYDWRFAAVTFVTIGGYIVYTLVVTEWRIQHRRTMNEMDNEANTKAVDSLLNYETVKYFGNEEHETQRLDHALVRYERAAVLTRTSLSVLNLGQAAIIAVGVTLVMLMAANGVVDGNMTVGDFVLVNAYLVQLYLPLNFLGVAYREIKQSMADLEALFGLLSVPTAIADVPGAPALAVKGGEIRFEAVSFGYDPRRPILDKVSFTVPPGRTLAIVGASGAGKSTIGRLLFRFYDTNDGRVLIDGQDIKAVGQASLRAAIGVVPQDTVLFNDTIRYNIAYGRPEAGEAEIVEAARLARLHDFILSLPEGYETRVGERGLKLSGGEKQRVAIARTILKGPPILLFDEATSSLDSATEREIQQSLRAISAERTTIVIAHRLSTVVDAHEIVVLDEGRVVERGRHADLLAAEGRYARLWRRQQEAALRPAAEADDAK